MQTKNLLKYWRVCVKDSSLPTLGLEAGSLFDIDPDSFETGKIPFEIAKRIFDRAERTGQGFGADPVEVALAPLILKPVSEHGSSNVEQDKAWAPFWIPALLDQQESGEEAFGRLGPKRKGEPWVSREYLTPISPPHPSVGTIGRLDTFRTASGKVDFESWDELLGHALELFRAVANLDPGRRLSSVEVHGYRAFFKPQLMVRRNTQDFDEPIRTLYNRLMEEKALPPLIRGLTMAGMRMPFDTEQVLAGAAYLGHPIEAFPLAEAQRAAVSAAAVLKSGEVLAVNGPPGTGKTTLLQSLVASFWVDRALAGKDPPIILACSTNNRAVLNILDAFSLPEGDDPLARRWIPTPPDIPSFGYGMYLPSGRKAKQGATAPYPWARTDCKPQEGLPAEMEKIGYVETAIQTYVEAGETSFPGLAGHGRPLSRTRQVVDRLHKLLLAEKGRVDDVRQLRKLLVVKRELWVGRGFNTPEAAAESLEEAIHLANQALEATRTFKKRIEEGISALPLWVELGARWFSTLRERRDDLLLRPFRDAGLGPPTLPKVGFRDVLRSKVDQQHRAQVEKLGHRLEEKESVGAWAALESAWLERIEALMQEVGRPENLEALAITTPALVRDPECVERLLDLSCRHRLFHLAARYWEGRWLVEMAETFDAGRPLDRQALKDCESRFRRFCMITPLLVATFHRAPKVLSYYAGQGRSMFAAVDLLIVDEAGQVAPEIGAATFALAKKAVVVGDTAQIEPVRTLAAGADVSNLNENSLDPESEVVQGFSATHGTLMGVAQQASRFSRPGREDGLWLEEHRRCVPELVRYCNALVYEGRLLPKRKALPESERVLPALGWGHIHSTAERRGSSWVNEGEAKVIGLWLIDRREELESRYGGSLGDIVGVVTPFKAQATVLAEELRQLGLGAGAGGGPVVGTVHTFQGGERPVILFSPTVTRSQGTTFMMDSGPNLLNVAVSRAKDSFLVFGDMGMFHPESSTPSGRLARLLFERPENAVPDLIARADFLTVKTERLDTLKAHRDALAQAFSRSRKRVLIVSPYLTSAAVEYDNVNRRIAEASGRGVEIVIAYSADFYKSHELPKVRRVAVGLERAGAVVHELHHFHNKTLAVDEDWLVEGSFNWLSAARAQNHPHRRYEASMQCGRPDCVPMIEDAWRTVLEAVG